VQVQSFDRCNGLWQSPSRGLSEWTRFWFQKPKIQGSHESETRSSEDAWTRRADGHLRSPRPLGDFWWHRMTADCSGVTSGTVRMPRVLERLTGTVGSGSSNPMNNTTSPTR